MKNLDEVFPNGELTTTEFMAQQIHKDLCERLQKAGGDGVFEGDICVKLWESHKAWASYTAPVPKEADEQE
jgi:6-pyruvoyltetrahydropterin/6-carboxytetrahydropterin synthase